MKGGVHDDLPAEVCRRSEDHGLKLQETEAVIVDATPVKSAARPRSRPRILTPRRIGRKMKLLMIRTYIGHIFQCRS